MGTHPIFESDFDCLTDMSVITKTMTAYAFDSLRSKLTNQPDPTVPIDFPTQGYPLFVTWKFTSNGHLRGCIGCFDELNLSSGIYDYALTAALRDSRFKPVQESEIKELSCTVSLLTDFEPCRDPFDWTLENNGIRISFVVWSSIWRNIFAACCYRARLEQN